MGKTAKWELFCFLTLSPLSPRADSCCCSYTLVEFLQELSQDILGHKSLYGEGINIELVDSTGLPPFPFSLELLLWAATTGPLQEVLENRIRKSSAWSGEEEGVQDLVNGCFPGGMYVVSGQF